MAEPVTLLNVPSPLNSTTALATVNSNFTTIASALNDVLSLSGKTPNSMQTNLDMNSFQILNLPSPATTNSPVRLIDVAGNPNITVPTVGTTGGTVGLLNGNWTQSGNNTWTGTNTFNGTVTFPSGSIQFPSTVSGNTTFTGNNTYSGTSAFSAAITVTDNLSTAFTITDGNNPLTVGNTTTGTSQFIAYNLSNTTVPVSLFKYTPTQTGSTNQQLSIEGVSSRVSVRSHKSDNSGVNPQIVLSDLTTFGVPVWGSGNQTGIGLVGNGVQGSSAFVVDIANLGGATTGEYNSCVVNIFGGSAAGDVQNIITFFNGTGTNSWNGTMTATQAGARLGEICGCGVAGNGLFTQTETWSVNGYADGNWSGTNGDGSYSAPSNIVFKTVFNPPNPEGVVGGFFYPGTFAVGNWANFGNNFTGGQGTITLKNVTFTPGTMAGGGVLFVDQGILKYRGSSGTLTTLASA